QVGFVNLVKGSMGTTNRILAFCFLTVSVPGCRAIAGYDGSEDFSEFRGDSSLDAKGGNRDGEVDHGTSGEPGVMQGGTGTSGGSSDTTGGTTGDGSGVTGGGMEEGGSPDSTSTGGTGVTGGSSSSSSSSNSSTGGGGTDGDAAPVDVHEAGPPPL